MFSEKVVCIFFLNSSRIYSISLDYGVDILSCDLFNSNIIQNTECYA